jgi:hypothetical protein
MQAKRPVQNGKGLHKMTQAEHFKIVNDAYVKHRGGQMTSLELADGLNGAVVFWWLEVKKLNC